jgi:hypothetical protein
MSRSGQGRRRLETMRLSSFSPRAGSVSEWQLQKRRSRTLAMADHTCCISLLAVMVHLPLLRVSCFGSWPADSKAQVL